jgi:hypothetical protein
MMEALKVDLEVALQRALDMANHLLMEGMYLRVTDA